MTFARAFLLFAAMLLRATTAFLYATVPVRRTVCRGLRDRTPTLQAGQQIPDFQVEQSADRYGAGDSNLHLISLRWTELSAFPSNSTYSVEGIQSVTKLWQWKDDVLGQGLDFWIPKPRTLSALQKYLVKHANLDGCVVVSNCARLEILAVSDMEPTRLISTLLLEQLFSVSQRRGTSVFSSVPLERLDRSANISPRSYPPQSIDPSTVDTLAAHWTYIRGPHEILKHMCYVAAGMAVHPRRPDRPITFRPFSSRDAHILCQLKRTLDLSEDSSLSILLQTALTAGKAARSPTVVPELTTLRSYGNGNSKYDTNTPPPHVVEAVVTAVQDAAIYPCLRDGTDRLVAAQYTHAVQRLRRRAHERYSDPALQSHLSSWLHEPTVRVRRGEVVDEAALWRTMDAAAVRVGAGTAVRPAESLATIQEES